MRNRLAILALLTAFTAQSQITEGGIPPSFSPENQLVLAGKPFSPIVIPSVDKDALMAEDSRTPGQTRFAAPVAVDISMENAGVWATLSNGQRLWQCAIQSPGGLGLTLLFDEFSLPVGAKFYAYSPDHQHLLGAYTDKSCLPSGKFLIGILPGETAYLECIVPAAVVGDTKVHIYRADVSYDKHGMTGAEFNFGQSLPCNVNVNCPTGSNWQVEKKGVARILMVFQTGEAWCSGTLVANTAGTYEPYFLTAQHCQLLLPNPEFSLWRFDFDFEGVGCTNPAMAPLPKSVLGSERIAFRAETDFMLLKISAIPPNYNVYFNGWDRDNTTTALAPNTTMIHHPFGDIKKITVDTQAATIFASTLNWGGIYGTSPANSHWRTIPDIGIQQPGSSGSPLFDANKRIRGQLHGGSVSPVNECVMTGVYYGRFNQSWDQGTTTDKRLKEWLDPAGTNAITQNGYARPIPAGFEISGGVSTYWGIPMPGVKVNLSNSGGSAFSVFTDSSGQYIFENVTGGFTYSVSPERDTNDLNGVTTFDLVLISKHILGIEALNSPWKMLSADVNNSKSITTTDIVEARKVLLGINPSFPANTSWRFFPESAVFPDPNNPFSSVIPPSNIVINNLQANFLLANFKGLKIGDTNNTAAPGQ